MKTLYLLRHAKAEAGSKDIGDPERVLAARGREACALVGAYMKTKKYEPALVLSSPSARTRETLALVAEAAGIAAKRRFEESLYLASAEDIMQSVREAGGDAPSAMVVGHNPGMHHIALLLSDPRPTGHRKVLELKYPTCALAVLEFDRGDWRTIGPGQAKLIDFMTPEEL